MALTLRTNGSGGANLVGASWWNDYYNLLTGAMADQEITINNNLVLKGLGAAPSVAMTAAVVAGTGMGIGAYGWVYTFVSPDGESLPSPAVTATTTSGNQKVNLTAVAVGPTGTTARKLYRTKVGGGTSYFLLTTIANNTATTFTDTVADASLGTAAPPTINTFGGSLVIKDYLGNVKLTITNDGTITSGSGSLGNTTISGTLAVSGILTATSGIIGNGKFGKTTPGDVLDASGGDTTLKITGATNTFHFFAAGSDAMTLDYQGHLTLTNNIVWQNGNGLGRTALFSGSGSGTYTHGLGATPTFVAPITHQSGSATQGYDTEGSTTVHITLGAALTFQAWASR